MEEITAEQFLEGAKAWDPGEDFEERVVERLRVSGAPEETVEPLGRAFKACSRSTYDYIEYIHELATAKEIGRQDLLPVAARLVALVQGLQGSSRAYREAFRDYDVLTRGGLSKDHFDTVYYDAIQNIELRVLLKKVITEVEALLQSFSLVSGELSKVKCVDLYEASIRLQLFLQYFMTKERFSNEELWSVLFDVFNQMGEMEGADLEASADELRDLHAKIQKFRTN